MKTSPSNAFHLPLFEDKSIEKQWMFLSEEVMVAREKKDFSSINEKLLKNAEQSKEKSFAALLDFWRAENYCYDKNYKQAIQLFEQWLKKYSEVEFAGIDLTDSVLDSLAIAYEQIEKTKAIEVYNKVVERRGRDSAEAYYKMGFLYEQLQEWDKAQEAYQSATKATDIREVTPLQFQEMANKNLNRLKKTKDSIFSSDDELIKHIRDALSKKDGEKIKSLATPTHFLMGVEGSCTGFVPNREDVLERLVQDLSKSSVNTTGSIFGEGIKKYLPTGKWKGDWFRKEVYFILESTPSGWVWIGLVLSTPTSNWIEEWTPENPATNQPLPFSISSPFPKGRCFMAGGLWPYVRKQSVIAGAVGFFAAIIAAVMTMGYALRKCGFGPRGFYYNYGFTHAGRDAFAVDFTRYARGIPYSQRSKGTNVLNVALGVVSHVERSISNGDSTTDNHVWVQHAGTNPNHTEYESRYLHLEGPDMIPVSFGMYIRRGRRLGTMDDTGNSALNHLHFVIRDINNNWNSVRCTPMDGQRLGDNDDGRCVCSNTKQPVGWHLYEGTPPTITPH